MAVGSDNSIFINGTFVKKGNFGNDTLTAPDYDCFLCKVAINGDLLWVQQLSPSLAAESYGLAITDGGEVYWSGFFVGIAHFGNQIVSSKSGDSFWPGILKAGIMKG